MVREETMRTQTHTKNYKQLKNADKREIVFSSEEHTK